MPKDPVLKLKLQSANPINKNLSWEDPSVCKSPSAFAEVLTRMLFVDAGEFASIVGIVRSDAKPQSADTNKLWAKTSSPPGIGVYAGGRWVVSYQYPINTPFLWDISISPIPVYMTAMNSSAVSAAGLTAPTDTAKWAWVIFNPPV